MTVIRLRGFKIFTTRHGGKQYCYHRKTGESIDLVRHPVGSAGFNAECARIEAMVTAATPKPGTLGMLIEAYRGHAAFLDLAPRTRSDYQSVFDYLKRIADTPLIKFDKPLIVRIRDKAAKDKGRKFANDVKARFSGLFGWGSERGYLAANTATGIKEIATNRSKTGEPVFWPCPAPLTAILAAAPQHDAVTLVANSNGRPWTVSGFRASWRPIKRKLEREGQIGPALTLYGLRHTVAVILREVGYDERTIADALGQKTLEMARHYAKGADLKPKMRGVVRSFEDELNKRKTKTVKPAD